MTSPSGCWLRGSGCAPAGTSGAPSSGLPQQQLRLADLFRRQAAHFEIGSQTNISSSGMPILWPVQRPRCWSGKKRIFSRWPNAHSRDFRRSTRCIRCRHAAAEGLEVGRRVDVGDRRDFTSSAFSTSFSSRQQRSTWPGWPCRPSNNRRRGRAGSPSGAVST